MSLGPCRRRILTKGAASVNRPGKIGAKPCFRNACFEARWVRDTSRGMENDRRAMGEEAVRKPGKVLEAGYLLRLPGA